MTTGWLAARRNRKAAAARWVAAGEILERRLSREAPEVHEGVDAAISRVPVAMVTMGELTASVRFRDGLTFPDTECSGSTRDALEAEVMDVLLAAARAGEGEIQVRIGGSELAEFILSADGETRPVPALPGQQA